MPMVVLSGQQVVEQILKSEKWLKLFHNALKTNAVVTL
jgi:hypothetical protein